MNFHIITFGCKVNQCESENIHGAMINAGYDFCENVQNADIVIINSCTVTAESDRKLRQTIHKIKRENSACIVVLMGCMPQAEPENAAKISGVNIVIGNKNKIRIPQIITAYIKNPVRVFNIEPIKNITDFENAPINCAPKRSRAFLKIEDGCNRFCSYCIIPYARGRVRSKPIEEIRKDALNLAQNGYKEIVLTGINLSSYGLNENSNLAQAVKAVGEISGVQRVRLGSLEPDLITDDMIEILSKEKKFCPQFHLALQSGSNEILSKMRRKYTCEDYLKVVQKIKKSIPSATFTTDVMVGFPGETEKNFEETLNFILKAAFLKVHVFPYSSRPGTLAADMPNQIDKKTKSERVKQVIAISEKSSKLILSNFLNSSMPVLYETKDKQGFFEGYTPNYILVKTKSEQNLCGKIIETRLTHVCENFCEGFVTRP